MTQDLQTTSTRPYLIRALHEWCGENGLTPYVTVVVDNTVQVPREFVKDGEIVLNIGFDATMGLKLGNDFMEFKARFGGVARDIFVPMDHVVAIFAKENGQGMAFPRVDLSDSDLTATPEKAPMTTAATHLSQVQVSRSEEGAAAPLESDAAPKSGVRPSLTRIK